MSAEEVTPEDLVAELATLTQMSPSEVQDFLSATPAQQLLIIANYRGCDWTVQPDTLARILAIVTLLGTIAGAISGIGGAVGAIVAIKSIL